MSVRWDPERPPDIFFRQSAIIHAHVHHLRMLLHRSKLTPSERHLSSPSLILCANAARACCSILEVYLLQFSQITPLGLFHVGMSPVTYWTLLIDIVFLSFPVDRILGCT
jgi:hypothetical protein